MGPYRKSVLQNAMLRSKQQLQHPALNMCVSLTTLIRERSACPQAEPVAAADAAAEPEEDVQMEELEHEIEAAAAPEEPEEAEDELAGEMEEEENTGKPPSIWGACAAILQKQDSLWLAHPVGIANFQNSLW